MSVFRSAVVHGSGKNGLLIFLHGSGDTGAGIREWLHSETAGRFERLLNEQEIGVMYPSARPRPYTLFGGQVSSVWFDRKDLRREVAEDPSAVNAALELREFLETCGTPPSKIVVAGFSQGGALALSSALVPLRSSKDGSAFAPAAGVIALSSFLNSDALATRSLSLRSETPAPAESVPEEIRAAVASGSNFSPVFMSAGTHDSLIPFAWSTTAAGDLQKCGVDVQFVPSDGTGHEIVSRVAMQAAKWAIQRIQTL